MQNRDDDRVLVDRYKAGSDTAAQELFDKYCERLLGLARRRIGQRLNSRLDPEDVLQSAFRTFFIHAKNDEFTFQNEDDLFKLLVRITVHKTLRQIAFHRAAKRNPGQEMGNSDSAHEQLMQATNNEPTPEAELALIEHIEGLMQRLSPFERQVLELKLQGHSSAEIAEQLGSYERKIRRALEHVREVAESTDDQD
jgi:RNA polymerase sigma-70 factor (ECF subfamily)